MNTDKIETTLRSSPPVKIPAGLLSTLQTDIELPRAAALRGDAPSRIGMRRWLPAFGFAVWFLGCVVVLGFQTNRITELRHQQDQARAAAMQASAEAAKAKAAVANSAAELAQLRREQADVQRLRAEVAALNAQVASLAKVREANEKLRDELNQQGRLRETKPQEDFFAVQEERAARSRCINNIKLICLGGRLWANRNKVSAMPADLESLRSFLNEGQIPTCPKGGTYEVVSPGAPFTDPSLVFVRCAAHNNVGLCDGSAHILSADAKLVNVPGTGMRLEK